MVRLWQQRLQLKLFSLIKLRKQCCLLVPFLFGEANPNPNLKPTWLAIMASRARPDEPEVSRWRAGGGARRGGEHPAPRPVEALRLRDRGLEGFLVTYD